jgi:hypothetical protein
MPQIEGEAAKMLAMGLAKGMSSGTKNSLKSNGKDCPECKSPLYDTEGGVIHLDPPRKRVKCKKCTYKGFRSIDVEN